MFQIKTTSDAEEERYKFTAGKVTNEQTRRRETVVHVRGMSIASALLTQKDF